MITGLIIGLIVGLFFYCLDAAERPLRDYDRKQAHRRRDDEKDVDEW